MTFPFQFPQALQVTANALIDALRLGAHDISQVGTHLLLNGDSLSIPARIYLPLGRIDSAINASTDDARRIALCIGMRHHDGVFREECVRKLGAVDRPWLIPFMVLLLGEYVVEIVEAVAELLPTADPAHLAAFVAENPAFMATTRRRAVSYWNCYYRQRYPDLRHYPGVVALDGLLRLPAPSDDLAPLTPEAHQVIAAGAPRRRGRVIDTLL